MVVESPRGIPFEGFVAKPPPFIVSGKNALSPLDYFARPSAPTNQKHEQQEMNDHEGRNVDRRKNPGRRKLGRHHTLDDDLSECIEEVERPEHTIDPRKSNSSGWPVAKRHDRHHGKDGCCCVSVGCRKSKTPRNVWRGYPRN